jgi:hypothetical protein
VARAGRLRVRVPAHDFRRGVAETRPLRSFCLYVFPRLLAGIAHPRGVAGGTRSLGRFGKVAERPTGWLVNSGPGGPEGRDLAWDCSGVVSRGMGLGSGS